MTSISTSFTATGVSASLFLESGQTATYTITGTFVATLVLQITTNGGQSWQTVATYTGTQTSLAILDPGTYRWNCTAFTSGTAVATLADALDPIGILPPFRNAQGETVIGANENGLITRWIFMQGDVYVITGAGAPTSGTSGTGATFAGPGSLYLSTGGSAYLNTNTKASPTWTLMASSGGTTPTGPAGGNLAGTYPNPTFNTAVVTAAALTVLDDTTVGAMVDTLGGAAASGTGGLARVSSPAFTTPNIGVATGSVSGNAGTATVLATTRAINGVNFDGSAAITVPMRGADGFGGRIAGTLSNATTTIELYAAAAATITFLKTQLSAGTATVSLAINGTPVTGSSVSATTSVVSGTCSAANTVAAGDKITIVVASVSSAADLDFTVLQTLL